MRKLIPLAALLVIGGCGASGGDRGEQAPAATLSKPVTPETLNSMPPEARQSAQASMQAGAAMQEQMNKRYGGGNK